MKKENVRKSELTREKQRLLWEGKRMKLLNELSQTDGTKHMIAECIETARNYDRIVLFGAGVIMVS